MINLFLALVLLKIEPHFTETEDCTAVVCAAINNAKEEVLVQAYNFTDPEISKALDNAHKRKVRVTVIIDRVAINQKTCQAGVCSKSGVIVYKDSKHKIAHNKIMVIDGTLPTHTILTGSFNWSDNAQHFNAENLVVITEDQPTSDAYRNHFYIHYQHSEPWEPVTPKDPTVPKTPKTIQHPTKPKK